MSQNFTIRDDLYQKLKELKTIKEKPEDIISFSDVIGRLLDDRHELNNLQEAVITQEGRITKTLAGKTILYRVKTTTGDDKTK